MGSAQVFKRLLAAAAMATLWCSAAQAAPDFDFVAEQSSYLVAPGQPVLVKIFLQETVVSDASILDVDNDGVSEPNDIVVDDETQFGDGLFSAVARIEHSGTLPSNPAVITGAARNTTSFGDQNSTSREPDGSAANLGGTRSAGAASGTGFELIAANVRRVEVGTLTITAGDVPLQQTMFRTRDPLDEDRIGSGPAVGEDTLDWADLLVRDSLVSDNVVAFTVTTTPEPSALGLVATAGVMLLGRRRRR